MRRAVNRTKAHLDKVVQRLGTRGECGIGNLKRLRNASQRRADHAIECNAEATKMFPCRTRLALP